jgi:pimeloyl-ACP methyl ester carboxylesterase
MRNFATSCKSIPIVFALLINVFTAPAFGSTWAEIKTQWVRITHSDPQSPKMPLKYAFRPAMGNSPTVVFLPGGPGQKAVGSSVIGMLPEDFGYLGVDPRDHEFPNASITTHHLALDIAEIIESLNINRLILYGTSFGTVLGTYLASILESSPTLPDPERIVFEGIAGRSFFDFQEYAAGFQSEWSFVINQISSHWLVRFAEDILPFGYTREQWGNFIFSKLFSRRETVTTPHRLIKILNTLDKLLVDPKYKFDPEELRILQEAQRDFTKPTDIPAALVQIGGREIWPSYFASWSIDAFSALVPNGPDLFETMNLDHPFDAKNFSIKAPIVYFQGDKDPATPLHMAVHHFYSQYHPDTLFFLVKRSAHAPFQSRLGQFARQIWRSIGDGSINESTFKHFNFVQSFNHKSGCGLTLIPNSKD